MVSLKKKIDSLSEDLLQNAEEDPETVAVSNGRAFMSDDSTSSAGSLDHTSGVHSTAYRRRATSREWPPRKQPRTVEFVEVGCLNVISGKYESLDYDVPDSDLLLDEEQSNGMNYETKKNISRWIIFLLIGVFTAGIGTFLDIAIDQLSEVKYGTLKRLVDRCVEENCIYYPYLMWVLYNVGFVLISSLLVTYVEPVAAGSGIPQVKCYLNGVKVPRVVRIKTLLVKVVGVVSSVVGGLAVGKVNLRVPQWNNRTLKGAVQK